VCGISGVVGNEAVNGKFIIESLKRLTYRGYDSWGILSQHGTNIHIQKAVGDFSNANFKINQKIQTAIGHTRWATHGKVTIENAHPHPGPEDLVYVVHNGIVENYLELKQELESEGNIFKSQTDTEVIAHLIEKQLKEGKEPFEAIQSGLKKLKGQYAIVILFRKRPNILFAACNQSSLLISSDGFIASDKLVLSGYTDKAQRLEDGDIAIVTEGSAKIFNNGTLVDRPLEEVPKNTAFAESNNYPHFMLKEIHEQPKLIEKFVEDYKVNLPEIEKPPRIVIFACGSSWHAASVGKFFFEELVDIPTEVEYASELLFKKLLQPKDTLYIAISQSGETKDTLSAIKYVKEKGYRVIGICNRDNSLMTSLVDSYILTNAGPEIGVAATKSFTMQCLNLLEISLSYSTLETRYKFSQKEIKRLPSIIECILNDKKIEEIARQIKDYDNALFLGTYHNLPIALEGALKLKEVSYIHAEGMPSGEIKHGSIALIDEGTLSIFVLPSKGKALDKILSNLNEVKTREGAIVAAQSSSKIKTEADWHLCIDIEPQLDPILVPIVMNIPLQLLAYYVAVERGKNPDKPRNLAKSVTVD